MEVLIAGASGLIGTELTHQLEEAGHTPLRLVRREPRGEDEFRWDPGTRAVDLGVSAGSTPSSTCPAHRSIGCPGRQDTAHHPGIPRHATRTLTDAIRRSSRAPQVLVNASAVGYYGDRPARS
jgi:NAD dependent epimerase/dehydratase family enzyme